jgi:predicted alpha/beta superfamily hydrolase
MPRTQPPNLHVAAGRPFRVWCPTGAAAGHRHPVLYLLDGQNVFDDDAAFAGRGWRAHATTQDLADRRRIDAPILVAVDTSTGHRTADLTPWPWRGRGGRGALLAQLLLQSIVPFVDAHYPTRPAAAARGIGGASLGGLFALHLALVRPDVFGACAALSPSLWWADDALPRALAQLPGKRPVRVWIDAGAAEPSPLQQSARAAAASLQAKGWQKHRHASRADLRHTLVRGGRHDEASWGRRFDRVLRFLFPPPPRTRSPRRPRARQGTGKHADSAKL